MAGPDDPIYRIYAEQLPNTYDEVLSPEYAEWKKTAIDASLLKIGDSVLVFCCGTGNDFSAILDKIGTQGSIVGLDFSMPMLLKAREKIVQYGWKNVSLTCADATRFSSREDALFDAGVCTLGMSIIPQWQAAYRNLLSNIKIGGEVIIGDMTWTAGIQYWRNFSIVKRASEYGGSYRGHANSKKLFSLMVRELEHVRRKSFFHGAYQYCLGTKGPSSE